ncbi:MAG TPA: glycosyltransferase family 4 protein [Dehalococcoidia bacterium]|nr:glycosyltransferase family 4 protein [Dehalococcoidia bacterium]
MKTLIVHFRSAPDRDLKEELADADPLDSAGTDGVSLEMAKRQTLLKEMGHEVAICSAYDWADFPVPALEFNREQVTMLVRNLYGAGITEFTSEAELRSAFDASRLELQRQLRSVIECFAPDLLFIHNIFSLPVHPAATVSLTGLLREKQIPCAAIHHDMLSEGAYKFTPTCDLAKSILSEYYPPSMANIRHWTINTRNKKALWDKGVDAKVIHDSMDFEQRPEPSERARIRAILRAKYGIDSHDVVLFSGARIVPNKQTELAGHLTAAMLSLRQEIIGKKLYHGDVFSDKSKVFLVLAGRPERAFLDYRKNLFELFDTLKIQWSYVGDDVRPHRNIDEGLYALYPDFYTIADFVLYPTGWEGFGNQLLEALAAELPVAVFEYPVFKEDIAPTGVKIVSLGDKLLPEKDGRGLVKLPYEVLQQAGREIIAILTSPEVFRSITDHNVAVGKKYFSYDVLRAHLRDALQWAKTCNG